MHTDPPATEPAPRPLPRHQLRPYRRTALTYLLRGASYGLGTTTISLAALWLQQHL